MYVGTSDSTLFCFERIIQETITSRILVINTSISLVSYLFN